MGRIPAMVWLESITPKPGFVARAIWSNQGDLGRRSERGSGGLPAKWYDSEGWPVAVEGHLQRRDQRSHVRVSLFHDLVANDQEKRRAAEHLSGIAAHIIDNGWCSATWMANQLAGVAGIRISTLPLRPGLAGPEWSGAKLHVDRLGTDRSAQVQAGTGAVASVPYHTFTVRNKHAFPPDVIVPWDDELAYRSIYPMLRYADDPYLRSIYLRALSVRMKC